MPFSIEGVVLITKNDEKENIMQIESKKVYLADIKSAYILKKVFDKVRNYTKFEIIRYSMPFYFYDKIYQKYAKIELFLKS